MNDSTLVYVTEAGDPRCPRCGTPMTGHLDRGPDPRPPEPGDFTVCVHCRGVAVYHRPDPFGQRIALRAPTGAERAEFLRDFPAAAAGELDAARATLDREGLRVPHEGQTP